MASRRAYLQEVSAGLILQTRLGLEDWLLLELEELHCNPRRSSKQQHEKRGSQASQRIRQRHWGE